MNAEKNRLVVALIKSVAADAEVLAAKLDAGKLWESELGKALNSLQAKLNEAISLELSSR